jgi:hypothetical protein
VFGFATPQPLLPWEDYWLSPEGICFEYSGGKVVAAARHDIRIAFTNKVKLTVHAEPPHDTPGLTGYVIGFSLNHLVGSYEKCVVVKLDDERKTEYVFALNEIELIREPASREYVPTVH